MFLKALAPHFRNWKRSLFRWNSISWFFSRASSLCVRSVRVTSTEYKMTAGHIPTNLSKNTLLVGHFVRSNNEAQNMGHIDIQKAADQI